jgi:phospholipase/carboxylesterase
MVTYKKSILNNTIEVNPSEKASGSIIWLHGLGADGNDFLSIVPELNLPSNLPLRFVFPHAPMRPVTINNGYVMRAWFDIYSNQLVDRVDEEGIANSVQFVHQLIEQEQQLGIPSNKIILAGFSQGAVISLLTGLRYPDPLAGILALSGFLPSAEKIIADAPKVNQTIPIFMGHGSEDGIVPLKLGLTTANTLKAHHYPVAWHPYDMAHSVCIEEVKDIADWLKGIY